jgi:hypothetical protein
VVSQAYASSECPARRVMSQLACVAATLSVCVCNKVFMVYACLPVLTEEAATSRGENGSRGVAE